MKPAKSSMSVLQQICKFIPSYLVTKLSKKHGIDKQSRSFSAWSHVVSMLHCHLAHSLSLNDISDTLRNHSGKLFQIRQATPPSRNGLSHANKIRSAAMAKELFWKTFEHLQKQNPKFGMGKKYSGLPHRFKSSIVAVDSTIITLVVNCIDWAKHSRRKAAAKMHLSLSLNNFLPRVAVVTAGNKHDSSCARELCANLKDGEIALFDKAYIDYGHLYHLHSRGVFWVTRAPKKMNYSVVGQHSAPKGNIIEDSLIVLDGYLPKKHFPKVFRLVMADVLVDGEIKRLRFISNNLKWAPSSVCNLYKSRWGIEVFFKQIKQTLKLGDFLGYSENAIRWQIWTGLLAYLLLRFISYLGKWKGQFSRLLTLLRGVLFHRFEMFSVLASCGTARASPQIKITPQQTFF